VTADLDPVLRQMLDRHVPVPSDGQADWAGVIARAASAEPVGPRRRRRFHVPGRNTLIGILAAALLTGFAGAAAHHRIFRLIGIDEPASGSTEHRLVSAFPWPHGLHVLVSRSRVVFTQRQPSDFDRNGPTRWADGIGFLAPLSNGQICGAEDQGAGSDWACTSAHTSELFPFSLMSPIGWRDRHGHVHAAAFVFWGIAPAATVTVTLEGPGSERLAVPLSPVTLPGRVAFVIRVPGRMLRPGGAPTALVAENANGAVVARRPLSPSSFKPYIYNRSSPPGARPSGPIISTGTLLELQIGSDTHRYSLQSENGGCLQDDLSAPTGRQTDILCDPPTVFAPPDISAARPLATAALNAFGVPSPATVITTRRVVTPAGWYA
jgi:hypothetical protein